MSADVWIHLISKVREYLAGDVDLAGLEEWLAPHLPALHAAMFSKAKGLLGAVELGLAEMDAGLVSEEELRKVLEAEIEVASAC